MQTCFSNEDPENLTVACSIYVHQENRLAAGTVWGFYPCSCHVESQGLLTPGMTVSLFLHASETARVTLGPCVVTWARSNECGLQFRRKPFAETQERSAL